MKKQILTLTLIFFVSLITYAQETYTIGKTEYYKGQYYETTGKPVVKRSEANKRAFLNKNGLTETPMGYEIDHIKPLSEGGTDDPNNMQLLTVEQHKLKTAIERANRSNSTYHPRTYTKTSTYFNQYNNSSSTFSTSSTNSRTDSNGRKIYIGSRGGEYYMNSSGNKVYVKSENSSTTSSNSTSTSNYYSPSSSTSSRIQTGSRGGKYYINSNGNKTYVKKN
jgi:hypothetical protein